MIGVKKAFTLMEVVVAVAIFAVIILAAVRIFQSSLQAQREINWDYTLQADSQYFFSVFSREVQGAQKSLAGECNVSTGFTFSNGTTALYFKNSLGQCVTYTTEVNGGVSRIKVDRDGTSSYLSGLGVEVKTMIFSISDSDSGLVQPRATVNLQFVPTNTTNPAAVNMQLTVSPTLGF